MSHFQLDSAWLKPGPRYYHQMENPQNSDPEPSLVGVIGREAVETFMMFKGLGWAGQKMITIFWWRMMS